MGIHGTVVSIMPMAYIPAQAFPLDREAAAWVTHGYPYRR
jgi:hypothetical protein